MCQLWALLVVTKRQFFTFISLTVQDRGIVAMEYLLEIVYDLSNGTIANALEGPWRSLLLFETFTTLNARET